MNVEILAAFLAGLDGLEVKREEMIWGVFEVDCWVDGPAMGCRSIEGRGIRPTGAAAGAGLAGAGRDTEAGTDVGVGRGRGEGAD